MKRDPAKRNAVRILPFLRIVTGLAWTQPVADVLSVLLVIGLYIHATKKWDLKSE